MVCCMCVCHMFTKVLTYLLTHLLTYLLTYLAEILSMGSEGQVGEGVGRGVGWTTKGSGDRSPLAESRGRAPMGSGTKPPKLETKYGCRL